MSDPTSPDSNRSSRSRFRFFPRNFNDGSLIYACLILASIAGIIVIGLSLYKSNLSQKKEALNAEINKDWIENLVPTQADLIDALLQDVNPNRTLVLFENGTVVIVAEPSEDPQNEAIEILKKNADPGSIFAVNKVGEDYAIRFKGPVFTRLSGSSVTSESDQIRKNWQQYLSADERKKIEATKDDPDHPTQVGLIARSFLLRDLENLNVSKILKARPSSEE